MKTRRSKGYSNHGETFSSSGFGGYGSSEPNNEQQDETLSSAIMSSRLFMAIKADPIGLVILMSEIERKIMKVSRKVYLHV